MEPAMEHDSILLIDPVPLLGIVAVLVLVNSVIFLRGFCSFLRCLVDGLHYFFVVTRRGCGKRNAAAVAPENPDECSSFQKQSLAASSASPASDKSILEEDADLSRGEVKMVMKRLGIFGITDDQGGETLQERIGAGEMARVFEEEEVSLEEVKEAFYVFDGNCDGFVDASELSDVLRALGFGDLSESECQELIRAFDENGDGLIDFREFAKLVQRSFQH